MTNELMRTKKGSVKEKVNLKHCFIEELSKDEDKKLSRFKDLKFREAMCPLTNK